MKRKRIWVVSEMFHPDETSTAYIMTAIAESLSKSLEVHVLCGPKGYGNLLNENSQLDHVQIHRIKAFNLSKNNVFLRLFRLVFLSLGMFFYALNNVKRTDKLLLVTNPAFSIPFFSFLKKIKGFKYFILVHDVFPENLIPAKILKSKKNIIYKLLKAIFDCSYKQADKLFVLGRDMKEVLRNKTDNSTNLEIIENWADVVSIKEMNFHQNEMIQEHELQHKIVLLFAGNLGRVQGLEFLFEIISSVQNDLLHFVFIGDGAMLPELQYITKQKNMDNVTFMGTFPRDKQPIFLNACHFGIVTLDEEVVGLGVPSKTYNILAAAKPIFYLGNTNSEVAQLIKEHSIGVSFSESQKDETITFLNSINYDNLNSFAEMGRKGRLLVEDNYTQKSILNKFYKAITDES